MMRTRIVGAVSAVAVALWGCAEPTGPRIIATEGPAPSADVVSFVTAEGLKRVQKIRVLLDIPAERAQVFRVVYGDSFPVAGACVGGCGYAFPSVVGLRVKSHVGWLFVADTTPRSRFDVLASDSYLFTEEFFTRFERADELLFQQPFKALLAADPDTPEAGLWLLVRGLASWISPWIAGLLLDNPNVVGNRAMLTSISQLPVFQGDAYRPARERALRLLNGE